MPFYSTPSSNLTLTSVVFELQKMPFYSTPSSNLTLTSVVFE